MKRKLFFHFFFSRVRLILCFAFFLPYFKHLWSFTTQDERKKNYDENLWNLKQKKKVDWIKNLFFLCLFYCVWVCNIKRNIKLTNKKINISSKIFISLSYLKKSYLFGEMRKRNSVNSLKALVVDLNEKVSRTRAERLTKKGKDNKSKCGRLKARQKSFHCICVFFITVPFLHIQSLGTGHQGSFFGYRDCANYDDSSSAVILFR